MCVGVLVLMGPPSVAHALDCTPATRLIDAGDPQRAIAWIDGVNAGVAEDASKQCDAERATALENVGSAEASAAEAEASVAEAQRLTAEAAALGGGDARNKLNAAKEKKEEAKKSAEGALALDRQNARAVAFLNPEEPTPDSWWQATAKGWTGFVERSLTPLGFLLVSAALLFAALLAVARILASMLPWRGKSGAAQAHGRLVAGVVLTAVASIVLVGLLSGVGPTSQPLAYWVIVAGVTVAAGVGVWHVAWGTARKLRIVVTVRDAGAASEARSAHVLALLEQFGASPPKGIERPVGPDVNVLADTLFGGEPGWLASVRSAISAVFGWTPWWVTVDYGKDPEATVTMTRNGRSAGSMVITSGMCTIEGAKVDPAAYVAAFVLVTLARAHEGFEGLCGATDAEGLALQYTAVALPADKAKPLLLEALRLDPASWLTRIDYENCQWRESPKRDELLRYDEWLTGAIKDIERPFPPPEPPPSSGPEKPASLRVARSPLLLRLKITRAAVRINLVFAVEKNSLSATEVEEQRRTDATEVEEQRRTDDIEQARKAIVALCIELGKVPTRKGLFDRLGPYRGADGWLLVLRSRAAAMASSIPCDGVRAELGPRVGVTGEDLDRWKDLPRGPEAHYSWACAAATPGLRVPTDAADVVKNLLPELRRACVASWIAEGLHDDPQMAWFRENEAYEEFRPKPRSDLLALRQYDAHRPALKRVGLTDVHLIVSITPEAFAAQLGIASAAARQLVEAAKACVSLTSHEALQSVAVEAVAHLLNEGKANLDLLRALPDDEKEALSVKLANAGSRFTPLPTDDLTVQFRGWLSVVASGEPAPVDLAS